LILFYSYFFGLCGFAYPNLLETKRLVVVVEALKQY
jgi:hypothetical protein